MLDARNVSINHNYHHFSPAQVDTAAHRALARFLSEKYNLKFFEQLKHSLEGNLIANMVRETGDHGPFNSWDRIPYLTIHTDGTLQSIPMRQHIRKNFIVNGYNGVWALDHDDGSSYYNDTSNLLVYGGCKN